MVASLFTFILFDRYFPRILYILWFSLMLFITVDGQKVYTWSSAKCVSRVGAGVETSPIFNPINSSLVGFRATHTAGYQDDQYFVYVVNLQTLAVAEFFPTWTLSALQIAWALSGDEIYVLAGMFITIRYLLFWLAIVNTNTHFSVHTLLLAPSPVFFLLFPLFPLLIWEANCTHQVSRFVLIKSEFLIHSYIYWKIDRGWGEYKSILYFFLDNFYMCLGR